MESRRRRHEEFLFPSAPTLKDQSLREFQPISPHTFVLQQGGDGPCDRENSPLVVYQEREYAVCERAKHFVDFGISAARLPTHRTSVLILSEHRRTIYRGPHFVGVVIVR